tara:strand:+ start:439 stop:1749 length:1311 start_codon:yes stop_codon:yes gene_type:complete
MELTVKEIVNITGGQLFGDLNAIVNGVSTDSRSIGKKQLFVPIIAERNGHDFVSDAMAKGASGHLFSQGEPQGNAIKVNDTLVALQDLAKFARKKIAGDVVGITGSVGKTTTKDILFSSLRNLTEVHVSKLSYNNELGLPLTILAAEDSTKHLILEMGARGPGQIAELAKIASPTIGIITRVASAHTEFFRDIDHIAETKGALIESLPSSGTAILNNDDPRVAEMAKRTDAGIVTYGLENATVTATNISMETDLTTSFQITTPWGTADSRINIPGVHNVTNALAAISAGLSMGFGLEDLCLSLADIDLSPMRMESKYLENGNLVINDSYNANPASMNAAIDTLLSSPRTQKYAVVGTMAELGSISEEAHREVASRLTDNGIQWISVAEPKYGGQDVSSWEEALTFITAETSQSKDAIILIKGSRIAELDQLAAALR